MTIPVWALLGFAIWTVLLLVGTVGVYRWSHILTGRTPIREFRADNLAGSADWYRRAMRAHANCVENLPVFAAVVFAVHVSETAGPVVDSLSLLVIAARLAQSVTHVAFTETDRTVSLRFGFFFLQMVAFVWLAVLVVLAGL